MNAKELIELVSTSGEQRGIEIKQSIAWTDESAKIRITKTILGMSNIRGGGMAIIGFVQKSDGTFDPVGMTNSHFTSFVYDDLSEFVAKYADQYAIFTLDKISGSGKDFILIRISEFESTPVICKRNYQVGKINELEAGAMYTRTRRKPETSKVMTSADLREILELASEKEARQLFERASAIGLPPKPTDKDMFDKQIEGLP